MKITQIEVFVLKTELDTPFAFSQGWVHQRAATLVRVRSDNGLVGWGEAFAQGLEPPEIAAAVIEHALKPLLIDQNPLDTAVLWQRMYTQTRDFGRKGSVVSAISAIDTALWDLAGHFYQKPIHQLLGGATRSSVQPYATGFYRLKGKNEASRLADEALAHREAGFTAMKVKLGFGVEDDIAVMQAVRMALNDDAVQLMVDSNHAYGRSEALRLGLALDELNLRWYEEPVVPEDIGGYVELRAKLRTPLAGGENEHTPYGFFPLFQAGALDVAQPDIGSCGGITAARDIVAIAQACGVAVNPHVWGSAIAQAASLQFIAALPVPHASLYATEPLLEYDRSSHPFRQDLVTEPWGTIDGMIAIPKGPGLGIDVRMDTVEKYQTN
ncbi:MAG: mandelate racemase/muconate lactonizing enzyme family protein [Acidiferrobacterales bacterium]|nr:mandelate racemase/muconate lactonizing enzyme family protein [Acidiferrobacterales bacterium]